jgi:outer membrane receptor protein involved in Fe transport
LFTRVSTNYEKQWYAVGGGYHTNNSIIDFEIQDNIELPSNTISLGANYRIVKFDINEIYNTEVINYVDPKNTENLKGLFFQDKISLLDNKLNIYLGIKAENFSLINDKYYLSPMAKIVINPLEELTIWGGYSKSYTTPGYNQTNIEFRFFSIKSDKFYGTVVPAQIYQQTYQTLVAGGMDAATANATAMGYLGSPQGQDTIAKYVGLGMAQYPKTYKLAAINGPETAPTSISNLEFGIRYQPSDRLYIETNVYYNSVKDGVINSPVSFGRKASLVTPNEYIDAFYYGNYLEGTNYGIETILKILPAKGLTVELSHSMFAYKSEFQKNNDFDINTLTDIQKDLVDEEYPTVPRNIFRAKVSVDLPKEISLTFTGLYATGYYNRFGTVAAFYEYDLQRYDPLFSDKGMIKYAVGENENRTVVNFKLSKSMMDKKMNIYLYGTDILTSPFVESVNQLTTIYPRQTGSMFGLGLNYNL